MRSFFYTAFLRNLSKHTSQTVKQKKPDNFFVGLSVPYVLQELSFLLVGVSLIEFVHTTCCIHKLHITCVERVRCI